MHKKPSKIRLSEVSDTIELALKEFESIIKDPKDEKESEKRRFERQQTLLEIKRLIQSLS